jgi:lipopolysaccharide exporter
MVIEIPDPVSPAPPTTGRAVRRGLAWSSASNIVLRVGNLAVGIVMARLIAPEEFGIFAVALTVWSVLGSVAEFGLGADLVRREDYQRHLPTVSTMGALLSLTLAAGMFFGASGIAELFGSPQATGVVQLMAVPMALIGLSVVPAALLQRAMRQGALFAIDGSSLVVSTSVTVVLALLGLGPAALALGRIAGQSLTVLLQYLAVRRWPVFGWDPAVVREAAGFGLPLALANVVGWSIISIDNLIVARLTSPVELGLYALAFNVASWPMSVAGQSVRVIALPAFSRLTTDARRGIAMLRVSGLIWSVSALMALGLVFVAPQLVGVLYGERWIGAAAAVVPLAVFGAFRVIFDLAATYLIACGRTGQVLVVQVVWAVALIPAMIVGVNLGGLAGAGWAHVLVAVVVVLPAYLLYLRRSNVPALPFLRAWLMPTAAGVPLALVLWLVTSTIEVPLLVLAAAAAAGVLVYVLPMARWWRARARGLADLST